MTQLTTLGDLLNFAESEFIRADLYFGHGTDNAWDEAVALCLHVMQLPHTVSRDALSLTPNESEKQQILNLISERCTTRRPLPYLLNEAYFCQIPFYVDDRVLIPRSPTAELIEHRFQPWVKPEQVKRILDIGTGSACIAIACALAFPQATVDASDISNDSLAVAKINVEKYKLENRVHLIQSDLFSHVPTEKYDIIISNPPYVDQADMASLPSEYQHEPQHALFGGNDGLDLVKTILKEAKNYLTPNGILVVEVGNSEVALTEQFPTLPFIWLEFECGGDGVFLLTANDL